MKRFSPLAAICALLLILWVSSHFAPDAPYLSGDAPFDRAARKVMPEWSDFADSAELSYDSGKRGTDEWLMLKAVFPPEEFRAQADVLSGTYPFYEEELILGAPFCACENPYVLDGYVFSVVELEAYAEDPRCPYAMSVAVNEQEYSIVWLFVSSDDFEYMGMDGVTRGLWQHIG